MLRLLILCLSLLIACDCAAYERIKKPFNHAIFANEEAINHFCLRFVYPQIKNISKQPDGRFWLILGNDKKTLYSGYLPYGLNSSMAESMAQAYPLEPDRPATPAGFAPGRKRPYDFWQAIYGQTPADVQSQLKGVNFQGKRIKLSDRAADAFSRAAPKLEQLTSDKTIKAFLKPEGGYYWRKIAGETELSPHSFGIAMDLGVAKSPYWRWSKQMPHPLQQSYPSAIVRILEDHGFIWGGKWHEYDIMHFEYRPELICKARLARFLKK